MPNFPKEEPTIETSWADRANVANDADGQVYGGGSI